MLWALANTRAPFVEKGDASTTVADGQGGNDSHDGQGAGLKHGQGQRDDRGQQRGGGGECGSDADDVAQHQRDQQGAPIATAISARSSMVPFSCAYAAYTRTAPFVDGVLAQPGRALVRAVDRQEAAPRRPPINSGPGEGHSRMDRHLE